MRCSYCQKQIIRNLTILELLIPSKMIESELCESCTQKFSPIVKDNCCEICQKVLPVASICQDCQAWQRLYPELAFCLESLYNYDDEFSEWLKAYKISGNYQLRHTFQKELKQTLKKYVNEKYLICPLPLSKKRLAIRGFNQVSGCLQAAEIPIVELLQRRHTKAQSKKNRSERLALEQPFKLKVAPEKIYQRKILLVDDVYTTGRTMLYAAVAIAAAQPEKISGFSLAR